jgi:hypothetical protein
MRGLTIIDSTLERAEMQTAPGMAHWAGSGPENAKCGDCIFYGYGYQKTSGDATRKTSSCGKFWRMTGRHGGSLDKKQIGCKYFEKNPRA